MPRPPDSRRLPHETPSLVRVPETDGELQRFASGAVRVRLVADYLLPRETPPHAPARVVMHKLVGGMLMMEHESDARQYARLVNEMPPVYCLDTRMVYVQGDAYAGTGSTAETGGDADGTADGTADGEADGGEAAPRRWLRPTPARSGEGSGAQQRVRSRREGRGRGRGDAGDGEAGGEAGGGEADAEAGGEAEAEACGGGEAETATGAGADGGATGGDADWKADFLSRLTDELSSWTEGDDDAVPKSLRQHLARGYSVIGTTPGWCATPCASPHTHRRSTIRPNARVCHYPSTTLTVYAGTTPWVCPSPPPSTTRASRRVRCFAACWRRCRRRPSPASCTATASARRAARRRTRGGHWTRPR